MKKLLSLSLPIVLIVACSQEREIIGVYKSDHLNNLERGWKHYVQGYDRYTLGTTLELKADSSFYLETCGNMISGHWTSTNDTLLLNFESNIWRNDSLQKYGLNGMQPSISKRPIIMEIKGNRLISFEKRKEGKPKRYNGLKKEK